MPKANIQIIDPTKYNGWDELLLTNPETTFFHTQGWAKVLIDSYDYKPLYFTVIEDGQLAGLIAVMEINSWLTGKRGVSLPFTDDCPVVAQDNAVFKALFSAAVDHGRLNGWKTLGLRGGSEYLKHEYPNETFFSHQLALEADETAIFKKFRGSSRRNVKKAEKQGVNVELHHSRKAMNQFYQLNCITRKDHRLPPQPNRFFDNIHRHIVKRRQGVIIMAYAKRKAIAGAVYFHKAKTAIYKYGASNRQYQNLRANNLVMWEAIRYYAKKGLNQLDFGRTELEHDGLRRFKSSWGTSEDRSQYYKYDFKKGAFISKPPCIKSSYSVFNKMPIPLLKLTGRVLYKHIG